MEASLTGESSHAIALPPDAHERAFAFDAGAPLQGDGLRVVAFGGFGEGAAVEVPGG